jgi:hypothetical protein
MARTLSLFVILLAGCASPSPGFLMPGVTGAERGDVVVNGRSYVVWHRPDGAVQVIRMGYVPRRGHGGIMADMQTAARLATGCALAPGSAEGDTGVMNARLDCPNRPAA